MKKYQLFLLVLATVLLLSGCQCKHEWREADCLNPKVCTNCQATEGEALGHAFAPADCENGETCTRCGFTQGQALGHSWAEASCIAPETCSLCGSTRGDALPHSFNKWQISGEEMIRECEICYWVEISDIDQEVFFWDHIVGHWDPYIVNMSGNTYWATVLGTDDPAYCLWVRQDHTAQLLLGKTIIEGTCELAAYEDTETDTYYRFVITSGEDKYTFVFYAAEDGDSVQLSFSDGYVVFSQQELVYEYIAGLWATADDGVVRSLTLYEDGTFDYNGEITGQWHIRPAVVDEYNSRISNVLLSYTQDGEEKTDYLELHLGDGNIPLEEFVHYGTAYGYAYLGSEYYSMSKTEPEQLVKLEAALTAGQEKLLGTWNSQTAGKYIYDDTKSYDWIREGYSLEFREDGTFTAQLDKEKAGTWRFTEVTNGGNYMYYHYELEYEDAGGVIDLSISLSESGTLDYTEFYEGRNEHYSFRPGEDPAAEEGRNMLCRQWTSRYARTYMQDTGTDDYWEETGYSLQFREDCTFSGTMEEPISGIWVFTDSQDQTYPDGKTVTLYMYTMQVEGEQECMYLIYDGDTLTVSFYDSKCNYTWAFSPITE